MKAKRIVISQTDVRDAILRFQERGGLIKILPPQPDPIRNLVGAKWAAYETVIDDFQTIVAVE